MESKLKALQKSPRLKCATALQGGAIAYRIKTLSIALCTVFQPVAITLQMEKAQSTVQHDAEGH